LPRDDLDNPSDERSDELPIVSKYGSAGLEDSLYMDVSENRGTPKWMVFDGQPY